MQILRSFETRTHKKRRTLAAASGAVRSMLKVFDIHPSNQPVREPRQPATHTHTHTVRLPATVPRSKGAAGRLRGGSSNSTFVLASNVCPPQSAQAFYFPRTDCTRSTLTPRCTIASLSQYSPWVHSLALRSRATTFLASVHSF